ncbi:host-nuclease inhibitor Gam family protein [Falsiroseomonas sp.]|uniref:host-nuclease inhibitor Gam family protein n=1 Tax=Falsiroseomonas sp. TaxID=2870721 RepID=UPI003F72D716
MARVKRQAEVVRAPADRAEASAMLAMIGAAQRDLAVIKAAQEETISAAKLRAELESLPLQKSILDLTRGLQLWAEANRQALTDGGKTKTVPLATGTLSWRHRPASVRLTGPDAVLAEVERLKLEQFLRRKVELNREAMLEKPELARTVPGVTIGSAGEDFIVAPSDDAPPANAGAMDAPRAPGSMAA